MTTQVLRQSAPIRGTIATCPTAGIAPRRNLEINLDSTDRDVVYNDRGVAAPFGFTLKKGETESFIITARTSQAAYRWRLNMRIVVDGKPATVPIGPSDGFQTSATDVNAAHWEWNYIDGWDAVAPDGLTVTPTRIPAGAPLPPLP
jgi:hypothetical protein